ncbi:MAG: ComF family protein, partial [Weeksellaceae bacterium]
GVVRKMLKQAKYQFISVTLKELITNAFATVKPEFEKQSKQDVVLIPIPLHTNRLKWRGFNQAQIIAKIVSQETDIPLLALLKRDKETQPQAQMSTKAQRKENIKNAFTLVSTKHTPTTVILVDDVFTSGATMNEAAKLLKQAGIKKVIGFTLLRGER